MLLPTLEISSLPVVVAQPDDRHATRTALCWSGMTDESIQLLFQMKKKHYYNWLNQSTRVLQTFEFTENFEYEYSKTGTRIFHHCYSPRWETIQQ